MNVNLVDALLAGGAVYGALRGRKRGLAREFPGLIGVAVWLVTGCGLYHWTERGRGHAGGRVEGLPVWVHPHFGCGSSARLSGQAVQPRFAGGQHAATRDHVAATRGLVGPSAIRGLGMARKIGVTDESVAGIIQV